MASSRESRLLAQGLIMWLILGGLLLSGWALVYFALGYLLEPYFASRLARVAVATLTLSAAVRRLWSNAKVDTPAPKVFRTQPQSADV